MNSERPGLEEVVGTIVGTRAGCVVVELENGERLLCRSVRRLHRPLGFHSSIPIGRRARVRIAPVAENRRPLIVEVLCE
jgi:hypothetical protein